MFKEPLFAANVCTCAVTSFHVISVPYEAVRIEEDVVAVVTAVVLRTKIDPINKNSKLANFFCILLPLIFA
jgi:hypothetical protein